MSYDPEHPDFDIPQPEEPGFVTFDDLGISDDAVVEEEETDSGLHSGSGARASMADNDLFANVLNKVNPFSKAGTVMTSLLGPIGKELDLDEKNKVINIPDYVPGWTKAGGYRNKLATLVNYVTQKSPQKRSWSLVKGSGKFFIRVFIYNYTEHPIGKVDHALGKANFSIEIPPPDSKAKENFRAGNAYCFPIHPPGSIKSKIIGTGTDNSIKASIAFQIWNSTVDNSPWFSIGIVYDQKSKKSYAGAVFGKSDWNGRALKATKEDGNVVTESGFRIESAVDDEKTDFIFTIRKA